MGLLVFRNVFPMGAFKKNYWVADNTLPTIIARILATIQNFIQILFRFFCSMKLSYYTSRFSLFQLIKKWLQWCCNSLQHAVFPIWSSSKILWPMVQAQLERLMKLILTNDGHQYSTKIQNFPLILSLLLA